MLPWQIFPIQQIFRSSDNLINIEAKIKAQLIFVFELEVDEEGGVERGGAGILRPVEGRNVNLLDVDFGRVNGNG